MSSTAIIVAMFGSIMPAPLAMPTTRAAVPATVHSAILTLVSVVMMPRAARSIVGSSGTAGRAAMPASIRSSG